MKPCRLKIITACINPDENEPDTEVIHYVSQNKSFSFQYIDDDNKISEEEKNIFNDFQNEEEEREIVIRDKDELKTKKRISKGKVYLIDGLFTKNYACTKKRILNNKSIDNSLSNENKDKNAKKLHSRNKNNSNINKNEKKPVYTYKWEHNYDNKINTIYESKELVNTLSNNKKDREKLSSHPKNPPTIDYYHNNTKINLNSYNEKNQELINNKSNFNQDLHEINREDELKGEIIILKNNHEILFSTLVQEEKKIKQLKDDIKNKTDHEKIKLNRKKEVTNLYNNLN